MEIQKFEETDDSGFQSGNWKQLKPGSVPPPGSGNDGGKLYIQKGSKMNGGDFDEGFEEPAF